MRKPLSFLMLLLWFSSSAVGAVDASHEKLRFKNTFKSPEEVVRYYCARDASGFVWTGLLDVERRAFTTWDSIPETESFYVAKSYTIGTPRVNGARATVSVTYDVSSLSDAFGTQTLPQKKPLTVEFQLVKTPENTWKIQLPDAAEIAPVVLEGRFSASR